MSSLRHDTGILFIHVPRTSGTSMENAPWIGGGGHLTFRSFLRTGKLKAENAGELFKFAFVRNPYDRLLSTFCFLATTRPYRNSKRSMCKAAADLHRMHGVEIGLEKYVALIDEDWMQRDAGLLPQWQYTTGGEWNVSLDFIGRFETLQADFNFVCLKANQKATALRLSNSSRHPPYPEVYTPAARRRAYELYERDFKVFGYDSAI